MSDSQDVDVALFPIPNVVAFPGVDLPLHVFEPRYRSLVTDCVAAQRMIGVCHTIKAIHKPGGKNPNKPQSLETLLNTNQTTYKAQAIFSAGQCEILETLSDGRILANVKVEQRLRQLEELQSLPYRIVRCTPLPDEETNWAEELNNAKELQQSVHQRFQALVAKDNSEMAALLSDPLWSELSPADYSFRIFQCLRFDADLMQQILESRSAIERLRILAQLLQGSPG